MNKITVNDVRYMLEEEESEYLDFKETHHDNTANLVHDILCLSNSDCKSDKFILFGVNDNKEVIGVDGSRRKQADIVDCLRNSNTNRLPSFLLYEIILDSKLIDILHIKNTKFKPYFLLKDKKIGRINVRAGVVYTRNNDTNTPIDSSSSPNQIESMWKERFGLDESPLVRIFKYIIDLPNWHKVKENEAYYLLFPEFRIEWESEDLDNNFHEHWINKEYPCNLANMKVKIFYHSTQLLEFHAINLEYRSFFPIPRYYNSFKVQQDGKAYIINKHNECFICAIMDGVKGLDYYDKDFIISESIKEPLDVYLDSLKKNFMIYSLNIHFEEENINKNYISKDRVYLNFDQY